jgi:hypothetical protein
VTPIENLTMFGKELLRFLDAQGMSESIIKSTLKFDFTETSPLAFVHSMYVQLNDMAPVAS